MELLRNGLKLVAVQGLDDSEGSVNVPVKLVHNSDDQYINFTEQVHIRYINSEKAFEEILPSKDSGFYIPGKVFVESGPIQLAVHLINGDVERVTNELQFVVKKAPNGKTLVDPSEFSWQQLVDQYVNAKLDTFANKSDLSIFEEKVNESVETQNQNIESFKTEVNTSLSNQNTLINQTTNAQNSKITTLESRMDTFTSLKEGSTTGDAELIDARIGADGTKYPSAGDAMRGQIEQLKEDLVEYGALIDHPSLYPNEYTLIENVEDTIYISDIQIKANTYLNKIYIKAGARSENAKIYLIEQSTNKVLDILNFNVNIGENTIYLNKLVKKYCYIGINNARAYFYSNSTMDEKYRFNSKGIYESHDINAKIGDIITTTKSSDLFITFSLSLNIVDIGVITDMYGNLDTSINELVTIFNEYGNVENLPSLYDGEYANFENVEDTIYISDIIIEKGKYIDSVYINSGADSNNSRIFVYEKDTNKLLKILYFNVKKGVNIIPIGYFADKDCFLGINNTRAYFYTNSEMDKKYRFNSNAMYESHNVNSKVGDTATITKSDDVYITFSIQLKLIDNGLYTQLINADEKKYDITNFNFNCDNLLRYKEITESIGYSGRWYDRDGKKATNNDGAQMFFKTKGASTVTINFEQITVQTSTPFYAYSIDGKEFVRTNITNKNITLPDSNEHIIRIVIDGMSEAQGGDKWDGTIGVYIDSVTVDSGTLTGLLPFNKVGMFFGDSITEGINALGTTADSNSNSATNSYTFNCCKHLNANPFFVGYGGTGVVVSGSFHNLASAIDYYYNGKDTPVTYPDFIVINHGINDYFSHVTPDDYAREFKKDIDRLRVKYTNTPIIIVSPFREPVYFRSVMIPLIEQYSNCYYIDSSGWNGVTVDGTHLSDEGAKNNGQKLANEILKILGKAFFVC